MRKQLVELSSDELRKRANNLEKALEKAYEADYSSEYASLLSSLGEINTILEQRKGLLNQANEKLKQIEKLKQETKKFLNPGRQFDLLLDALIEQEEKLYQEDLEKLNQGIYLQDELDALNEKHREKNEMLQNKKNDVAEKSDAIKALQEQVNKAIENNDVKAIRANNHKLKKAYQEFKMAVNLNDAYREIDVKKQFVHFEHANDEKIIGEIDKLIIKEIDSYRKEQAKVLIADIEDTMQYANAFYEEAQRLQDESHQTQTTIEEPEPTKNSEQYIGQHWLNYAKKKSNAVIETSKRTTLTLGKVASLLKEDMTKTKIVVNKENIIQRLDSDLEKFQYALQFLEDPAHIKNCKNHILRVEKNKKNALLLLDRKLTGQKIDKHEVRLKHLKENRKDLTRSLNIMESENQNQFNLVSEEKISSLSASNASETTGTIALPLINDELKNLNIEDIPELEKMKKEITFEIQRRHIVQEELDKNNPENIETFMGKAADILDFLDGTKYEIERLQADFDIDEKIENRFKKYKLFQEVHDIQRLEEQYEDEDAYGDDAIARRLEKKIREKEKIIQELASDLNIDIDTVGYPTSFSLTRMQRQLIALSDSSIEETGYAHMMKKAIIAHCRKHLKNSQSFQERLKSAINEEVNQITEATNMMSLNILDSLIQTTAVMLPSDETNTQLSHLIDETKNNNQVFSGKFEAINEKLHSYPIDTKDTILHHIITNSNTWLEKSSTAASILHEGTSEIQALQDELINAQNNIRYQLEDQIANVVDDLHAELFLDESFLNNSNITEQYQKKVDKYLNAISKNPEKYSQHKINSLKMLRILIVSNQELFIDTLEDDTDLSKQLKQEYNEMIFNKLAKVSKKPDRSEYVLQQLLDAKKKFITFLPANIYMSIAIKSDYPKKIKSGIEGINHGLAYDYKKTLLAPSMDPQKWISRRKKLVKIEQDLGDINGFFIEKTGQRDLDNIIDKVNSEAENEIIKALHGRKIDIEKLRATKQSFDIILEVYYDNIIPDDGNPITMSLRQSVNNDITYPIKKALTDVLANNDHLRKDIDRSLRIATKKRANYNNTWDEAIDKHQITSKDPVPGHIADIIDQYHIDLIKAIERNLKIPYSDYSTQEHQKQQIEQALNYYKHMRYDIFDTDTDKIKLKKQKFNMILTIDLAKLLRTDTLAQYLSLHIESVEGHSLDRNFVDLANSQLSQEILRKNSRVNFEELQSISKQIKNLLELQKDLHIESLDDYEDDIKNDISTFNADIDQKIKDGISDLRPSNVLENLQSERKEFLTRLFSNRILSRCDSPKKYPLKNIMNFTNTYSGDKKTVIAGLLAEVTNNGETLSHTLAKIQGDTDEEKKVIESYYRKSVMAYHEAKTNNLNSEATHLARQKGMILESLLKETNRMEKIFKYSVSKPYISDTKIKLARIRSHMIDSKDGWLLQIQKANDEASLANILEEMIDSDAINMRRSQNPVSRVLQSVLGTVADTHSKKKLIEAKTKILALDKDYIYQGHAAAPAA